MEKPAKCKKDHLEFLDYLRESGITNMYGARPYLIDTYPNLTTEEAGAILQYWMKTFGDNDR